MFDMEGQKEGEKEKSNVLISQLQYRKKEGVGVGGSLCFPWDFLSER